MRWFDNMSEKIRTFALLLGAPVLGGMLYWQLSTLDPARWCGTAFNVAKADGAGLIAGFQACLSLQKDILNIKDHAILGLLTVLGLGYIMMLMREFRLQGEVTGPLGIGAKFNSDEATGAKKVKKAVDEKVEEIEDGAA